VVLAGFDKLFRFAEHLLIRKSITLLYILTLLETAPKTLCMKLLILVKALLLLCSNLTAHFARPTPVRVFKKRYKYLDPGASMPGLHPLPGKIPSLHLR